MSYFEQTLIYITRGGSPENTSLLIRYVDLAGGTAYIRPSRQRADCPFFH